MTFGEELRLVWFIGLNAVVLAAAWQTSRRLAGRSLSQALLDTLVLDYLIQYGVVCGLGTLGRLSPKSITVTAALVVGGLLLLAWRGRTTPKSNRLRGAERPIESRFALAILLFAAGYVLCYAFDHRRVPVLETDALAYHLPTAVGWLQSGRLKLFEAWYWNPANTYSPLAAEAFMTWCLAPMRSDIFVRFVQMPALMMVGLGMYRVCRQLRARPVVAACVAMATMLSRSIFAQATLVKDDLFVVAFFVAAVAAMGDVCGVAESDESALEDVARRPWVGPIRIGIAVGLLIATKYPALLTLPLLFLLVDNLLRRWTRQQWAIASGAIALVAGPWFVRNWVVYANPVFPMIVKAGRWVIFHGLFDVTRDAATRTPAALWAMVSHGYFGTPGLLLGAMIATWVVAVARFGRSIFSRNGEAPTAMMRFAIWGPVVGPVVFSLGSPHPEIRYFFPFFLPLFAATALGLRTLDRFPRIQVSVAVAFAVAAALTSFESDLLRYAAPFFAGGAVLAVAGFGAAALWPRQKRRVIAVAMSALFALTLLTYVNWHAFTLSIDDAASTAWPGVYGDLGRAWIAARERLPADSTVAYANTNMIYPLFGPHFTRHVLYIAVRPGETSFADLPSLGGHVPQNRIVETVTAAMNSGADYITWLNNLKAAHVNDVFVARRQLCDDPPELRFARRHPTLFKVEYENSAAVIFHFNQ